MTKRETDTLEAHFEQARATPPQMPAGMMDRLIAAPSGLPDVATQIITGGDDYIVADATSLDTYTSDLTAFGWDLDEG